MFDQGQTKKRVFKTLQSSGYLLARNILFFFFYKEKIGCLKYCLRLTIDTCLFFSSIFDLLPIRNLNMKRKERNGEIEMLEICLLLLLCDGGLSVESSAVQSGQRQYEVIKRDSQMPKYGVCWTEALHSLERGCTNLNDQVQSRLALNFANCFLHQAGQRTYLCGEKEDIATCLRGIDSNAFSAYSNFFTHTQNMCQFLQQQIWHQETESAIHDLTKTSGDVAKSLQNSSKLQEDIMSNQLETLAYQVIH